MSLRDDTKYKISHMQVKTKTVRCQAKTN